jgi:hypothetical protein
VAFGMIFIIAALVHSADIDEDSADRNGSVIVLKK